MTRRLRRIPVLEVALAAAVLALVAQLVWPWWHDWQRRVRPGAVGIWNVDSGGGGYPALAYLPANYQGGDSGGWPLLLFLHGSGERGGPIWNLAHHGPFEVAVAEELPMIVCGPHCPDGGTWNAERLLTTLDALEETFHVDPRRVYVTGFSMGGSGTWKLAAAAPGRFAAMVPVCGSTDVKDVPQLVDLPIWAFHGEQDATVPVSHSRTMAAAVQAAGGNVRLTIWPDRGHGIRGDVYRDPKVYEWLLEQVRPSSGLRPSVGGSLRDPLVPARRDLRRVKNPSYNMRASYQLRLYAFSGSPHGKRGRFATVAVVARSPDRDTSLTAGLQMSRMPLSPTNRLGSQ